MEYSIPNDDLAMRLGQIIRQYESVKVSRKMFVMKLSEDCRFHFSKVFAPTLEGFWKTLSEKFSLGCLWAHNRFIQWQVANETNWLKTIPNFARWTKVVNQDWHEKMTNLDFKKSFFYNRKNLSQNRTNFLRQKVF